MGNDYSMMFESDMTGDSIAFLFYLVYMLFMLTVSVGTYVLQALSLYSIANRRGIRRPWLSWIPVGSTWILGCISDQYQYVVKGKVRNKRKALLVLEIIQYILASVLSAVGLAMLFTVVFAAMGPNFEPANEALIEQLVMEKIGYFLLLLAAYLVVGALAIAAVIVRRWKLQPKRAIEAADSWAAVAWEKAHAAGIMDGTRPRDTVTRQELAVVLNALNLI